MLYPLNALIASQEKRLTAWTKPLTGDVSFALYNGLLGTARKSNRDKAEHDVPHQVLYRETLRANPPPILVTHQTMLEYMTIRREDRKILAASRGKQIGRDHVCNPVTNERLVCRHLLDKN